MRPRDHLGHTLPLPGRRLVGDASVPKSLWVKQVRKPTCHLTRPGPALEQGPETRLEGHVDPLPAEEARLWVCPGRRARLKVAVSAEAATPSPAPGRTTCCAHTRGPSTQRALSSRQTRRHSQTLTPPSTSGQLDLTSAGPPLPCPSASTASPTLWTSGPLLLLWLAASTPACLATRAGAAHHLWPERGHRNP